jgi:Bacterial mobilisation protein (MobC)
VSEASPQRRSRPRRRPREPVRRGLIQVRVSDAERAALRSRADELDVSVSRLLIESALADDDEAGGWSARRRAAVARHQEFIEILECRRLLATVANNVNQLAKAANISGDLPGVRRLHEELRALQEVRDQLVTWTEQQL